MSWHTCTLARCDDGSLASVLHVHEQAQPTLRQAHGCGFNDWRPGGARCSPAQRPSWAALLGTGPHACKGRLQAGPPCLNSRQHKRPPRPLMGCLGAAGGPRVHLTAPSSECAPGGLACPHPTSLPAMGPGRLCLISEQLHLIGLLRTLLKQPIRLLQRRLQGQEGVGFPLD